MLQVSALILTFLALLAAGAMAGLFYAYSISVIWGLDGIAPQAAVGAMREINKAIQNPIFLPAFILMPLFALAAGALLLWGGDRTAGWLMIAAGVIYLLGTFGVTMAINVPMNEALERAGRGGPVEDAAALWANYSPRWTLWNHIRTASSFLSLGLVGAAMLFITLAR